jgi:hypothetical protein
MVVSGVRYLPSKPDYYPLDSPNAYFDLSYYSASYCDAE